MRPLLSRSIIGFLAVYSAFAADSSKSAPKQAPGKSPKATVAKSTAKAPQVAPARATTSTSLRTSAVRTAVPRTAAGKKAPPPKPRYYAQVQPSPERYQQIQQALADKGYFSGMPDGVWGPSSTEALKRFQHDQSLPEEGKVDSLSIIALGLGPKRTASMVDSKAEPITK